MSELALPTAAIDRERVRAWTAIGAWLLVSRAVVLAATLGLSSLGPHFGLLGPRLLHGVTPLASWDGIWYRDIAAHGYLLIPGHQSDPAFFPLYPMLVHLVEALGLGGVAAGLLVSNLVFVLALVVLYELSREWLPEADARRTAIAAAIVPMGFVFSMVYPESLALLLIAGAGLLARRGRWVACAALAAGAVLTRPEGLFVLLPIAAAVRAAWPTAGPKQRGAGLAAIAAGPIAGASFVAYLGSALGDPRAWFEAESAWGRSFTLHGPVRAIGHLLLHPAGRDIWLWRDLGCLLIYLALVAVAWRAGAPRAWLIGGLLVLLLPLGSGSVESLGRFGLLALPVYWGLAVLARRAWLRPLLALGGIALLAGGVFTLPYIWP